MAFISALSAVALWFLLWVCSGHSLAASGGIATAASGSFMWMWAVKKGFSPARGFQLAGFNAVWIAAMCAIPFALQGMPHRVVLGPELCQPASADGCEMTGFIHFDYFGQPAHLLADAPQGGSHCLELPFRSLLDAEALSGFAAFERPALRCVSEPV